MDLPADTLFDYCGIAVGCSCQAPGEIWRGLSFSFFRDLGFLWVEGLGEQGPVFPELIAGECSRVCFM